LVLKTLDLISTGNWQGQPQQITGDLKPAPKLNRQFCEIDHMSSCHDTLNKIRGLSPYPGAWARSVFGEIKILRVTKVTVQQAGTGIFVVGSHLYWTCSDGLLEILELQPAGKPKMKAADFINGLANKR
jgi:methionyl-tRNA formyltransferase